MINELNDVYVCLYYMNESMSRFILSWILYLIFVYMYNHNVTLYEAKRTP